jgi:hypothetical protein
MFNNANVIFRTKFVDGVSTVTRTVPGGRQAPSKNQRPTLEETSQGMNYESPAGYLVNPSQDSSWLMVFKPVLRLFLLKCCFERWAWALQCCSLKFSCMTSEPSIAQNVVNSSLLAAELMLINDVLTNLRQFVSLNSFRLPDSPLDTKMCLHACIHQIIHAVKDYTRSCTEDTLLHSACTFQFL